MLFEAKQMRLLTVSFILGLGLVFGVVGSLPDNNLHLVACDVGQGDAVLVSLGSTQVIIDGGPDSSVLDCLSQHMPFWDRTIEVVVLTHAQADHMDGLVDVLQRYEVEQVVANGLVNDTAGFREFREAVISEAALVHLPSRGDEIRIEPIVFSVLWPEEKLGLAQVWDESGLDNDVLGAATYSGDINEASVVLKLSYGAFDALLVGDLGFSGEEALIEDGVLGKVEVLKVGHHGSKYATSSDFLGEIQPKLALISVGKNNHFGHPTSDTLMRLDEVGARVLRTDILGDVEIVSDGEEYWVLD
jgi:competence protein ComEC